ncbi:hypothetical protein HGRIS_002173 [Hohenbuehelia grisea]|uniref:Uncharacterized protein n=1 Tax=Hohenbuehelia grisea TaxID=104357 RepID=A0ABR3JKX5_9AGAR
MSDKDVTSHEIISALCHRVGSIVYDGSSDEEAASRAVYEELQNALSLSNPSTTKTCPPVELVVHAAMSIIRPKLVQERIPELLDCITIAELYRQRAVLSAKEALEWNTFCIRSHNNGPEVLLTPGEETFIQQLIDTDRSMRLVYIDLLLSLCQIDIYLLWTAQGHGVAKIPARLNEYYPRENSGEDHSLSQLFQFSLSDQERQHFTEMRAETVTFLQETYQWATSYLQAGSVSIQTLSEAFQTDSFIESCEPEGIGEAPRIAQQFLNSVQENVKFLQSIFAPEDARATFHIVSSP